MFPSSVQRTYGSKKKAVGADAPGSVLKPSKPLDFSVFSPSPSPVKAPVAFTSARKQQKKAATAASTSSDGEAAAAAAVTGTARKAKAPGTASKVFAGTGWASAIKAPAPPATGRGKAAKSKAGGGGGGTAIKRRHAGAGARTPLRPLPKEDLFAAANERDPEPLELDPPPLLLMKPPVAGAMGGKDVDLGASASSLSSSQGSFGSSAASASSSPPLDAGTSGGSGGSGGSGESRRTKRGVPGSPREESSSLAKTTRLFSPVVKKKPPTGRSAAPQPVPMPAPGLLGRPPMSMSFLSGIGSAPPPSSSIFSTAAPAPPAAAAAAPVAPVMPMPMPAPVLPPQRTQQRRFSRRLSAARAAAALADEEEEETDMAVVSEPPAPSPAPAPAPAPAETPMAVTATPRVMRESARRAMAALTGGSKGGSSVDMSVASSAPSSAATTAAPGTATKARRGGNSSSSTSGGSTPRAPRSASKSRPLPGSAIKAPSGASASLEYHSLFAEAEEADLLFLAEEVKRGAAAAPSGGNGEDASWLFGFGKGFVLFLPASWDAARRARVRCLLLQLGFQGQANGGRIYYRTTQQRVTELRRELARWRSLQDEALASATTAAASTSFMALRAAEQEAAEEKGAAAEHQQQLQHEPEPLPEPPAPAPMTLRRSSRRLTGAWRERRAAAAGAADSEEDEVDSGAGLPAPPALTATGRKPRAPKAAGGTGRKAKAAGRRSATAMELRKALGSETDGEGEIGGQGMEVVEDEEVGGVVQSLGALALEASGGSLSMSQDSQRSPLPPTQPVTGRAPSPVAVEAATQEDGRQRAAAQEDDGLLGPIHVAIRGRNSITFRDPRPMAGAADEKDTSIMSWASLSMLSDGAGGGGGRPSGDSFIIRSRLSHGGPSSPHAVSPPLAGAAAPASAPNSGGSGGARTPTAVLLSPPAAQMDVEGLGAGAGAAAGGGAAGGHAHDHHAHHGHGHAHGHAHGHGAATFETPMGGKRRDWGVSARANTDSIHRLTQRFETAATAAADGADYSLLPSHMRYGMRSPPALALAAVVASSAPADAEDEELLADTQLSRRRSSLGQQQQQQHRAVEPSFAEMMPAAIAEGDEEEGEEEGQEQPSVLNASSASLGLGVSYMEDDANASALLNDAEGAAAAAAVMAAREANLLKRRRRSAAKARRVSMGLMARASAIRQHATDAWRQQHGAGGGAAGAAATAHPATAAASSGTGAMVVAGAAGAGQPPQRPRNSRLSLCSAMGGLSLTVSAAAGRRRSSRMLLSPPLAGGAAGAPAPRISEGGEEKDADAEAERSRGLSMSVSFIAPLPAGDESLLAEEEGSMMMQVVAPAAAAPASPKSIEKIAGDLTAACFEFLPVSALTARVDGPAAVCRAWATAALYAQAKVYSDFGAAAIEEEGAGPTYHTGRSKKPRADLVVAWSRVARAFPFGQFLSDGAYKQVYRVWAAGARRVEALSVMDVNAITESGNAAILAQELRASILMSALVRHRICPNHVETYGVLRTKHAPSDIWSCASPAFAELLASQQQPDSFGPRPPTAKAPTRAALARGDYQLIRMELCRHGDLEAYLRRQPDGLVSPGLTRLLLFQMCFGLYAARDAHAMRHYDVKLLNFLLADFAAACVSATPSRPEDEAAATVLFSPNSAAAAAMAAGRVVGGGGRKQQLQQDGVMTVRYGLGPHVYRLEMPAEQALCVKLADFGTADLVEETLGRPVGLDQFTTLENTPVDFLVDGDKAVQGYAADAFSLGLAALHLFTGAAPYEEVLEECLCPKELRDALARAWKGASFSVLRRVLEAVGDEEGDGAGAEVEGGLDPTLFHTFYRYLVLLGPPSEADMLAGAGAGGSSSSSGGNKRAGPVWRAVASLIGPDPAATTTTATTAGATRATRHGAGAGTGCRKQTAKDRVTERYWADHARFSLARGSHPLIARGRARLQALPGALPFLLALLDYVPARRPTMYAALSSPLFAGLRERGGAVASGGQEEDEGSSFLAYYRGGGEGPQQTGGLVLPPVREDI